MDSQVNKHRHIKRNQIKLVRKEYKFRTDSEKWAQGQMHQEYRISAERKTKPEIKTL